MPIKRFVYAAEEVAHAEKETLSKGKKGSLRMRESLFREPVASAYYAVIVFFSRLRFPWLSRSVAE